MPIPLHCNCVIHSVHEETTVKVEKFAGLKHSQFQPYEVFCDNTFAVP